MNTAFPLYSALSSTDREQRATSEIVRSFANESFLEFSDIDIGDSSLSFRYAGVELCLSWEYEIFDELVPLVLSSTPFNPPFLLSATKLIAAVHGLEYGLIFKRVLQGFTCFTQPSSVGVERVLREVFNKPCELCDISAEQFRSVLERWLAGIDLSPKDLNSALFGVTRAAFATQTLAQLEALEAIRNINFVTCPKLRYSNAMLVEHKSHTTVLDLTGIPQLSI